MPAFPVVAAPIVREYCIVSAIPEQVQDEVGNRRLSGEKYEDTLFER